MATKRYENLYSLLDVLPIAEKHSFALGSFSPRYTPMIRPVLKAGEETRSPLIVQISQKEFDRYGITPFEFAETFFKVYSEEKITVPVVLHLDHTKDISVIKKAIDAGFTSVMIDASDKEFEENVRITKEVVEYAHAREVSVEAELGKIGTTDFIETDTDEELYTDPEEARKFVELTGCDCLAVSVGTAHGVYLVRKPKIDIERLKAIRSKTPVHLVLHGGSGVPAEMVKEAIQLPEGGISKVNIATDLELAMLKALGREERLTNEECKSLDKDQLQLAQDAVKKVVIDKMENYVGSADKDRLFSNSTFLGKT